MTGAVDVQILNRLLEHRNFPKLIDLIRIYFQDTAAKGITARNQLIEMATASLSDLMKEHPEHRAEAKQDLQLLNAQKMGEHEAEIEKIKNVFLAILRDIKKDIDNGSQPGEAVTAAMFQAMRDALAEQKQNPLSIDDVTAMIAGQIGQLAPMDEEAADLLRLALTGRGSAGISEKTSRGREKQIIPLEQRAHLYTLAGVCALPRAYLRTGNFPRATIWRLCRNKGLHPLRRLRGYPCIPTKTVHPPLASVPFLRVLLSYPGGDTHSHLPLEHRHCEPRKRQISRCRSRLPKRRENHKRMGRNDP